MARAISPLLIFRLVLKPNEVFQNLAVSRPSAGEVFFKLVVWMIALPPMFAWFGSLNFGWRLGATEPLVLSTAELAGISIGYYFTLLFGFISTALVSRWMSVTYKARESLGIHFAMIAVVGAPLAVGSVIHLYPDVFVNILVLVPTLIWSMYLLYKGLPVVLRIEPERGMLMASALIGYLLVAFVSLLGLTVMLWGFGIGPRVGI
ncbi:MAG: DUF1282 domain-containing protein [Xanthomonadales bacterium]|nr:DUF1282 domain-containing protein [Xanthomonadales bacterium]NIN60285.1 DUF1282 domain-containing protein [Xanthomonadales bacterium]NIN75637.1 DUF1282 domain-containing protein [Xanthomonadales bacterium]NIO14710.1 DUF1282 domain-containing protein [Xanthomonadales bacterium]NIP12678.1 DUF1282 domain-containing protein [Xanthomonadales bacterium]